MPTHTATFAPTPALPALVESDWPTLPRIVFEKADHSLWAATFDRGQPWPVTGPLDGAMVTVRWAVSPDGRWLAVVQSIGWPKSTTGTLFLVHLQTGRVWPLIESLLPPEGDRGSLPPAAGRAALQENQPAWSPDSSRLAFVSAHEGRADLYVYEVNNQTTQRVATCDEESIAWPQWSPDGAWLLYHTSLYLGAGSGPAGGPLWAVSPEQPTGSRRLTPQDESELILGWLDDQHAIITQQGQPTPRNVALVDITSGERTPLLDRPVRDVSWSEEAQLLAVTTCESPGSAPGVWLIDPRQPDPVLLDDRPGLASLCQLPRDPFDLSSPRWSPDGRYLIYNSDGTCILYELTAGQTSVEPETWCNGHWSPHGQYIAQSEPSLQIVDVGTGQTQEISPYPANTIRWSPDGEWLLWLRQSGLKFDLFARRVSGGTLHPIAYQASIDALQRISWIPGEDTFVPPVTFTTTENRGQEIETRPVDGDTLVIFFRDRLLFRTNWQDETERIARTCTLDRLYPESNLHMTNSFYAFLESASNGTWVAIENDDHATCLVDVHSGEGYPLPAHARVSWEPQGTRFAYVSGPQAEDPSRKVALYVYDAQTHTAEPLFVSAGLYEAIWSPDGAYIAVDANYAGVPQTYWVLDAHTGEVRYTGPYDMHLGDYLRWSADGARLAISRQNTETHQIEWDVRDVASGEVSHLPYETVTEANGWQPDDVARHRIAISHSGHYLARAQPPQRTGESEWWAQPSMVSIIDLETGETAREWQVDGLVPSVRWSTGDGWLILGVLQVQDVVCEYPEFGPCGVHGSVWRLPVNGTDEPERIVDAGFLVEAVSSAPPTPSEILDLGVELPFEVCGESTTWKRPTEQEQSDKWWRSGRYSGADEQFVQYPWTHDFFVMYGHGSTTYDIVNLSGLWTLAADVRARCLEPERQDAIWGLQKAELWLLYHRVKHIKRIGSEYVIIVEPSQIGAQFVQIARAEQRIPLTFHFVTEDGQEIERIAEADSLYWPYPQLVSTPQP